MQNPKLIKKSRPQHIERMGRCCYLMAVLMLAVFTVSSQAQISLNVTNFGAVGDAVQFYVNTVSNSVVVTTTNTFSSADIGKAIELFGVGQPTHGASTTSSTNGWQDFIGIITNVVEGTNLYVQPTGRNTNYVISRTATGAWATCGTDNQLAFSNTIASAAGYTNATLYIPNGTYLVMPILMNTVTYAYGGITLRRGGLHFLGESQAGTVLLSRGAWQLVGSPNPYPFRGFLFEVLGLVTNDFPLVFEKMTWDGGVLEGNQRVHGIEANKVDGMGWDQQHSAYLTGNFSTGGNNATHQVFTNITVQKWRGESFKSIEESKNKNISIHNCFFGDIGATALNIYGSWDVRNNVFSNCWQTTEYYQAYYTNTSYFCNNFITNNLANTNSTYGNAVSINGGVSDAPPFIVQSNVLWNPGNAGQNVFIATPGVNLSFLNNEVHVAGYCAIFNIGAPGAQSPRNICSSNILISGNSIYCDSVIQSVFGLGGNDVSAVKNMTICSNYTYAATTIQYWTAWNTVSTGLRFYNNVADSPSTYVMTGVKSTNGSMFLLIETNNTWTATPQYINNPNPTTNWVSYTAGPKYRVNFIATGSRLILEDSAARQIPVGAWLQIDNRVNRWTQYGYGGGDMSGNVIVQPSQTMTSSLVLSNGQMVTFYWSGSAWTTNSPARNSFSLTVNSGSGSDTYASGTTVTVTANAISGKRFTYWSGATNLMLNPFATNTTLIMPAGDAAITANYLNILPPPMHPRLRQLFQ